MTANANLTARFLAHAKSAPGRPALIWGLAEARRSWTYAEVEVQSARAAAKLSAMGVGRGDRVLVLQPMAPTLYAAIIGILRIGAVAVFPDPQAVRATIKRAAARLSPRAVVGPPAAMVLRWGTPSLWAARAAQTASFPPLAGSLFRVDGAQAGAVEVAPDAPALATFTSGSTGEPKALVRTHGLLGAQQDAVARGLSLAPGQTWLSALPVFPLSILAAGATAVLPASDVRQPADAEVEPLLDQIAAEQIDGVIASPALGARMAQAAEREDLRLSGLSQVFLGGAPVFADMVSAWAAAAPGTVVNIAYGSSEAEPIAHRAAEGHDDEAAAIAAAGGGLLVGPATPETQLAILVDRWGEALGPMDAAGFAAHACDIGEVGEIVVAGDHVLPGYLDGVGDAETRLRVDDTIWFRTGDAGVLDNRGRLKVLGRCGAKLPAPDGRAVYPLQVEAAARAHARNARLAAVAAPDGRIFVMAEGVDAAARDRLREALRTLGVDEVVDAAPPMDRRHGSKVDYPRARAALRAYLSAQNGREGPEHD